MAVFLLGAPVKMKWDVGMVGDRTPVFCTLSCQKSKFGLSNEEFIGVNDKAVNPDLSPIPPIANGVL